MINSDNLDAQNLLIKWLWNWPWTKKIRFLGLPELEDNFERWTFSVFDVGKYNFHEPDPIDWLSNHGFSTSGEKKLTFLWSFKKTRLLCTVITSHWKGFNRYHNIEKDLTDIIIISHIALEKGIEKQKLMTSLINNWCYIRMKNIKFPRLT